MCIENISNEQILVQEFPQNLNSELKESEIIPESNEIDLNENSLTFENLNSYNFAQSIKQPEISNRLIPNPIIPLTPMKISNIFEENPNKQLQDSPKNSENSKDILWQSKNYKKRKFDDNIQENPFGNKRFILEEGSKELPILLKEDENIYNPSIQLETDFNNKVITNSNSFFQDFIQKKFKEKSNSIEKHKESPSNLKTSNQLYCAEDINNAMKDAIRNLKRNK